MIVEAIALEMSRLTREAHASVAIKMASAQLGEAWHGLDDRRHAPSVARGPDRRDDQREAA